MDYNKHYGKIINEMINKSFHELKGKKIIIREFTSKKYTGSALKMPFFHVIAINKKLRNDKKVLIGILSHELSHLVIFDSEGWIKYLLDGIPYWINPKKRKQIDVDADKLAIKKGYGKELYYVREKSLKNSKLKHVRKYYLNPKEIKKYMKKSK